eukprot:9115032-Ditylum_brightwellii.AAC.2
MKINESDDLAEYIKESCTEIIGNILEIVLNGGERNSNGKHWQIVWAPWFNSSSANPIMHLGKESITKKAMVL